MLSTPPKEFNYTRFAFEVEEAKRDFGEWDGEDPVCWAILRVVQAQSDFASAMREQVSERAVEHAIIERRDAIAELQKAFEEEPRGFQ